MSKQVLAKLMDVESYEMTNDFRLYSFIFSGFEQIGR